MLAKPLSVAETKPRQEATRANEINSSRDTVRTRDFDREMQRGRREQQQHTALQDGRKRQIHGKEANTAVPNRQAEAKLERQERQPQAPTEQAKTISHEPTKANDRSNIDDGGELQHQCEDCLNKEPSTETTDTGKRLEPSTEQKLGAAQNSATSQWLDTILSLTGESENAEQINPEDAETLAATEQISLSLVKGVLASIGSKSDLSELTGQEQVSLAQLKSVLTGSELQAIIEAQSSKLNTPLSSEQEFEQLLAQLSGNNRNQLSTEQNKSNIPAVTESIVPSKVASEAKNNEEQASLSTLLKPSSEVKSAQASASQVDKTMLEKQEGKFKPSSLLSAMTLNSASQDLEAEPHAPSKQTIAEMLAPTTKVLDIAGAASIVTETTPLANNASSVATQVITEQSQLNSTKLSLSELDMAEVVNKESSENKLASLLGTLAPEEVKTSDVASRAEKVNVAGVTLDKSLQMPKLENITQAKNEVVVRENILFNKQELATQMQTQVGIMLARNMKSVDIRLDPPELGSMQVKLSVQNDQATVAFVVSNQQSKDALENSLPKLKELLEQQGLQLADSDVQQQQSQAQGGTEDEEQGISKNDLNSDSISQEDELEQQQQMINRAINSPWNVSYYA